MLRSDRHHVRQTDLVTVDPRLLLHGQLPVHGSFVHFLTHRCRIQLRAVHALEGITLTFRYGCPSFGHRIILACMLDQLCTWVASCAVLLRLLGSYDVANRPWRALFCAWLQHLGRFKGTEVGLGIYQAQAVDLIYSTARDKIDLSHFGNI